MKIIRRFNAGGVWKQDSLSDKDIETVREILRKGNKEIMKSCIQDAIEILGSGASPEIQNGNKDSVVTAIALGLFDKIADMAFTRFQGELDERELLARGGIDAETERDRKLKSDPEYKKAVDEKITGDHRGDDLW